MERNKLEWSLTAVMPPRKATISGPRPADLANLGSDGAVGVLLVHGGGAVGVSGLWTNCLWVSQSFKTAGHPAAGWAPG